MAGLKNSPSYGPLSVSCCCCSCWQWWWWWLVDECVWLCPCDLDKPVDPVECLCLLPDVEDDEDLWRRCSWSWRSLSWLDVCCLTLSLLLLLVFSLLCFRDEEEWELCAPCLELSLWWWRSLFLEEDEVELLCWLWCRWWCDEDELVVTETDDVCCCWFCNVTSLFTDSSVPSIRTTSSSLWVVTESVFDLSEWWWWWWRWRWWSSPLLLPWCLLLRCLLLLLEDDDNSCGTPLPSFVP